MADFVQTMKDWRRMCKHYSDERIKDGQHSCVDMCPLGHNTACGMIEDALDRDIEVMAKEVAKWAAAHPEPVYSTWGQYFRRYYGLEYCKGHEMLLENSPADLAEKLGLKPKKRKKDEVCE